MIKTILHISDTHGKHRELTELPMADILIHSGDFTLDGREDEAYDFMNWLCDLPHLHKIFIAGNHDICLYGAGGVEGLPDNVHYLCNSGVEIGGVLFYGVPMFIQDSLDGLYNGFLSKIPAKTDVLITHQPPLGFCDLADYGAGSTHRGDSQLLQRIEVVKPKYHLFGHEHSAYGTETYGGIVFSNAALLDNEYNLKYKPRLFVLND